MESEGGTRGEGRIEKKDRELKKVCRSDMVW